jgi:hypothetical protein
VDERGRKRIAMNIYRIHALIFFIILSCAPALPAKAVEENVSRTANTAFETLKPLEGTIWTDLWLNMAEGRGPTGVMKIIHVDTKKVKGLYCSKSRNHPPLCQRFSGEIVAESPPKFRWITGPKNEIEFFFKDGRMVGSWCPHGRVGYAIIYAASMTRVESPPFPIEELEFSSFPADAFSALDTGNFPESLKLLANKTWEGTWHNSLTKALSGTARIRLAEYDPNQRLAKVYYSWIYSPSRSRTGIRVVYGTFEEGKDLILKGSQGRGATITLRLSTHYGKEEIHGIWEAPKSMTYETAFSPEP